ncbi:MAG: hypothetical protein WD716_10405 [Fimbriimonadaceae bacterium]
MKVLFGPFQIAALVAAGAGLVFGWTAFAFLGLVAWGGACVVAVIREQGKQRHVSTLSAEGRLVLKPIEKLRDEIQQIVETNRGNPEVSVIGAEALNEANDLIARAQSFATALDTNKGAIKTYKEAEFQLSQLREQEAKAVSDQERASLQTAIDAKESEVVLYAKAAKGLDATKAKLHEAQTALVAIKAQLAATAAGGESEELEGEGLTGMVGRLKSLSTSLEESEELRERLP